MKKLLYVSLLVMFVCGVAGIANAKNLTYKEVKDHIGEKVTVCGEIKDEMDLGTATLLGMGVEIMSQDITCVGIEVDSAIADKLPEGHYVGKTICVTGEVYENPNGGGSIKVTEMSQIKVK